MTRVGQCSLTSLARLSAQTVITNTKTRPRVAMFERTYAGAINALNSLQSNASAVERTRQNAGKYDHLALPEMVEYLERIGWKQTDLNRLNVVHITGTKGKGSTAAFVDSLLRISPSLSASTTKKTIIGLYTSPHMVKVRERIRLHGQPISETLFSKSFWEVWDRLGSNSTHFPDFQRKQITNPEHTPLRPAYFKYLTLLALHVFLSHNVRCAILEVGIGGRYDSTNIVPRPTVTGITTLGLDHTAILGDSIEQIAAQKAGIFKANVPAVSVWQDSQAARTVIESEARSVGVASFRFLSQPFADASRKVELGISGDHQWSNAQLAVYLSRVFLEVEAERKSSSSSTTGETITADTLTEIEKRGLAQARWPGRCQIVRTKGGSGATWYLDGAHTRESLEACAKWFASRSEATLSTSSNRILIFNTTHGRNGEDLLSGMVNGLLSSSSFLRECEEDQEKDDFFDDIIFCTNITGRTGSSSDLTSVLDGTSPNLDAQNALAAAWKHLYPSSKTRIHTLPSIEDAVQLVSGMGQSDLQVLVSGSLHLVGGVMSHLLAMGELDDNLLSRDEGHVEAVDGEREASK